MTEGFIANRNAIGVVGSILGILAGVASLVNVVSMSILTVGAYITEVALWFLWIFIQGIGFMNFYRERSNNAALATFVFAAISALIEVAVLVMIFSLPDPSDFAAIFASLIQLLIAVLIGSFSEAAYLIVGGVAILQITRRSAKETLGFTTGIVFILSGCFIIIGLFGVLSIFIPFFLIAANILACMVFFTPFSSKDQSSVVTKPEYGLELE